MPYTNNPTGNQTDEVRLLLGDTDNTNLHLQDEEITYFLTQGNNVSIRAAYLACQALIARYSQKLSVTVGPTSVNYQQLVSQLRSLSETLEAQGGRPSSLDMGQPIDMSSMIPSVIGNTDWSNHRVY